METLVVFVEVFCNNVVLHSDQESVLEKLLKVV